MIVIIAEDFEVYRRIHAMRDDGVSECGRWMRGKEKVGHSVQDQRDVEAGEDKDAGEGGRRVQARIKGG